MSAPPSPSQNQNNNNNNNNDQQQQPQPPSPNNNQQVEDDGPIVEDDGDSDFVDVEDDDNFDDFDDEEEENSQGTAASGNASPAQQQQQQDQAAAAVAVPDPDPVTKLGCSHYNRNCKLEAPCCKEFYWCRLCHNDLVNEMKIKCKEEFDRYKVKNVQCQACMHTQTAGRQNCDKCNIRFARYFCNICNLYDDGKKDIYHCTKCGMCRRGKQEDYYHCDTCDFCVHKEAKDHKCKEKILHQNCPVCLEFMFSSVKSCTQMKCGHWIHSQCFSQLVKSKHYTCPLCSKSIVDLDNAYMDNMINSSPMPEQYANTMVKILCNDCLAKSEVKWHVFGMKCPGCNSYNTKQL